MHRQRVSVNLPGLVLFPGLIANHVQIYRVKIFGGLLPAQVHLVVWMAGEIHYLGRTRRNDVRPLHDRVRVVAIVLPRVRLHVDLVFGVGTCKLEFLINFEDCFS